ncbi:MAG: hypothetical protein ACRDOK_09370 [Streptosporangiaceae bacterium]
MTGSKGYLPGDLVTVRCGQCGNGWLRHTRGTAPCRYDPRRLLDPATMARLACPRPGGYAESPAVAHAPVLSEPGDESERVVTGAAKRRGRSRPPG